MSPDYYGPNKTEEEKKRYEELVMLADKAADHLGSWITSQKLIGCTVNVLKEKGRTPMVLAVIEATPGKKDEKTILMYAHLDKMPPGEKPWRKGLGPYSPVVEGDKLYARGAADDGYGTYAIVGSIKACQKLGIPHDRIVVTIEACEESDSKDVGYYYSKNADKIKTPSLLVIMDSGCGDYERIWMTTSLRGVVSNLYLSHHRLPIKSSNNQGRSPLRRCRWDNPRDL